MEPSEEFGMKREEDFHVDQKLFYWVAKKLQIVGKQQNSKQFKNAEDKLMTKKEEIMEGWMDY